MIPNNESYKDILNDSYKDPSITISPEQRYNLVNELLKIGLTQSDSIIKIASMLNRKPNDNYYIIYGILMQYNNDMTDLEENSSILSTDKKSDALEETYEIISKNIQNKEFIDHIYMDIRLGTNIEKVYYPKQLRKDLKQIENFNLMINQLKISERF